MTDGQSFGRRIGNVDGSPVTDGSYVVILILYIEPKAQDDSLFMLWNSNLTLLYIHFPLFIFVCIFRPV